MGSELFYPNMQRRARNDPFGPTSHNALLERQDWLYNYLGVEHDPASGEHNTPHIARTLGAVKWSGAAYSLEGFNSDVSLGVGHNPATGQVILTLASGRGYSSQYGVVEVQCADETGNVTPWVAHGSWVDDTHVQVFLRKNTAGVGAQQVFAATDGDFFVSIRGPRIPNSVTRPTGANRRVRGEGLQVGASDWNPFIQAMGTNRLATLANHTSTGLHDCREVAKVCGTVRWDGTQYSVSEHRGLAAGVQRIATGQVRVYLSDSRPAMVAPVQAFVSPVSAVTADPHTASLTYTHGMRKAMVPRDTCGAGYVDVFLYESQVFHNLSVVVPDEFRWNAVDGDFSIRVHGA